MVFCSHNIRGLNNKSAFARDFIRNNNLSLIALLETHVKQENSQAIASFVAPGFNWLFNYDHHQNGRIWIGWNPAIWSIEALETHTQHISCRATLLASHISFVSSFIYALNTDIERRLLGMTWASFTPILLLRVLGFYLETLILASNLRK